MQRTLIALLAILAAGPAAGQKMILDRESATKAASEPAAQTAMAAVGALGEQADASGVVRATRRLAANPVLHPAGRDRLYAEAATILAALPDHPESRGFLEELAGGESAVWIPIEESAGYVQLPLYDFSAQARYSLRELDIRAAADFLSRRVAGDDSGLAAEARNAAPDSVFREGLERALSGGQPAQALADALAAELPADPTLGKLALAARAPADDEVLITVLEFGDLESSLQAVALTRRRPLADALAFLKRAARRSDVGSAAVLEAGRRQSEDPAATRWLEGLLGDPRQGASAAAGLARWGGPELAGRVAGRLAVETDEMTARHLLLVLRLSGTAAADREMARLRSDPGIPAFLRGELR
jgi:hypothetical protein